MKNFKKLALIAATAVVFSASAHADGQWGSDIVFKNLNKLGGTQAQFDDTAKAFSNNEYLTDAYLDQLVEVNIAQEALDAAAITNNFGSANTFGDFAGDTTAAVPTIGELVDVIEAQLVVLSNTRSTEVDIEGVVFDLFEENGAFTTAIENKLIQFDDQASLIGFQMTNLAKNIASDLSSGGNLSVETIAEITSIDDAIADVHAKAKLLLGTDSLDDNLGVFVGGNVSYTMQAALL